MPELFERLAIEAPIWLCLLLVLIPMYWAAGRRTFSKGQERLAAIARVLLVLALAFAASGLTLKLPAKRLGVVFVLDRSASMPEESRTQVLDFVRKAGKSMSEKDKAAVVVLGDGAVVEQAPSRRLDITAVESVVSPHQTDLAAGLRLAEALVPSDYTRRVVLLSDGEETRGDGIAQAASSSDDLELWTLAFDTPAEDEALLEGLTGPDQVPEGGAFELRLIARSNKPATGRVRIYRNSRLLGVLPVELTGGQADRFTLRQQADEVGYLRYRAVLEIDGETDPVPQNNVAVATVAVEGRPRILYVEGKAGQARHLQRVLEEQGLAVDVIGPGAIPGSLIELQPYSAMFLSDVPAYAMTSRQMEVIRRYVQDLGRGFAMFGGDESFGLGGYYGTPVEEVLPVRMDIQDKKHFPTLAMVIAMDKSGSMGGVGITEKLGMAKEAAIQTTDLMSNRDRIGVITFDSAASWAVPMTTLTKRKQIAKTISKMQSGGGTDIYPALKESYKALNREKTAQKHIILLSDGVSYGGDFETLIKTGRRRDITLSAVAIGDDSDLHSMKQWADWGGGSFYKVTRPEHIPRVFTRETMLATRSFLIEEPFQPALGAPHAVTSGLETTALPKLDGYVATEPKPRSITSIWAREDENSPLLTTWRNGLGRSAAWTSDCKTRWARRWLGTEAYTRTFSQLARWLAAGDGNSNLQAYADLDRGVLSVTVDAYDAAGGFRNFLEGEARFIAPDLSVRSKPLQQVAPGRYRAQVDGAEDGSHLVAVFLKDDQGNEVGTVTAEAAQAYSPEYRPASGGVALMAELSRVGRGRRLALDQPGEVFTPPTTPRLVPHPLWPPLLILAALLLLLDIAMRRIDWSFLRRSSQVPVLEGFGTLLAGRGGGGRRPSKRRRSKRPARKKKALVDDPSTGPGAEEPDSSEEAVDEPPLEIEDEEVGAYVGGLLAARRRARSRTEDDS